jgi:hypothetical protein
MAARATREYVECARSLMMRSIAQAVRAQASAASVALDRRCSAIERTNRGFTHLSPNLPFKPRLHNKDLQHNKTLK